MGALREYYLSPEYAARRERGAANLRARRPRITPHQFKPEPEHSEQGDGAPPPAATRGPAVAVDEPIEEAADDFRSDPTRRPRMTPHQFKLEPEPEPETELSGPSS